MRTIGWGESKPPTGARVNGGHSLSQGLAFAYLSQGMHAGVEPISRYKFTPRSSIPTVGYSSKFGAGWMNSATANCGLVTNHPNGWTRNQTYFSCAAFIKVAAVPGAAVHHTYVFESVADSTTTIRFAITLNNGALGATGLKWGVNFRTGAAASTRRDVTPGAGGTTVAAGDEACLVFTFDSVADLYTLYLNGRQEAQLSVAETAVANTVPLQTPILAGTTEVGSDPNGALSAFYVWQGRVLTATDAFNLTQNPYDLWLKPCRRQPVDYKNPILFLEPGTDATGDLSLFNGTTVSGGTVASDNTLSHTGSRSIKADVTSGGAASGAYVKTNTGTVSDAGAAISFWIYINSVAPASNAMFFAVATTTPSNILGLGITTGGKFRICGRGATAVDGATSVVVNTWYRLTVAYSITSSTVWTAKLYLNGTLEASTGNAQGTLGVTGASVVLFGWNVTGSVDAFGTMPVITCWFDDIYIDGRTDSTDPGSTTSGLQVTAKRPASNNTNSFDTAIGANPANRWTNVNEVPISTTNGWQEAATANVQENYGLEAASAGDVDISAATIIGRSAWIYAKGAAGGSGTPQLMDNGVETPVTLTSSAKAFTSRTKSSAYPSASAGIGMRATNTSDDTFLYDCGILIAYLSNSTLVQRTLSATQAQVASLTRLVLVTRAATQAATATLTRLTSVTRTTTQAQAAARTAQAQALRTAPQGQSASILRQTNAVRPAAQGTTATLSRALSVTRTATQSASASILRQAQVLRSALQGQAASVTNLVQAIRVATQGTAATISSLRVRLTTLAATQAQVATISRQAQAVRTALQAQAVSILRSVQVIRPAVQNQTASETRQTLAIRIATQGQVATQAPLKVLLRALSAAQAQAASLSAVRSAGAALTATQAQLATVRRAVLASRTVQQASAASVTRAIARVISAVQSTLASLLSAIQPVFRATKIYMVPASSERTYALRADANATLAVGVLHGYVLYAVSATQDQALRVPASSNTSFNIGASY